VDHGTIQRDASHLVKAVPLRGSSAFRPGHFSLLLPRRAFDTGTNDNGTDILGLEPTGNSGTNPPGLLQVFKAKGTNGNGNQRQSWEPTAMGTNGNGNHGNHAPTAYSSTCSLTIEASNDAHANGDQLDHKP
jgi:hypothetical protein